MACDQSRKDHENTIGCMVDFDSEAGRKLVGDLLIEMGVEALTDEAVARLAAMAFEELEKELTRRAKPPTA